MLLSQSSARRLAWTILIIIGLSSTAATSQRGIPARNHRAHVRETSQVKKKLTPLVTNELKLVDSKGRSRMVLTTHSDAPAIELLRADGTVGMNVSLDIDGHGSVRLNNPSANGATASLEVDGKGAHVKFDRPGGASSYLFLNDEGESGVVLLDPQGRRRFAVIVPTNGEAIIQRFGTDGKILP